MRRHISLSRRVVHRATSALYTLVVIGTLSIAAGVSRAAVSGDAPPPQPLGREIRSGGVLEESYVYHRQPPMQTAGVARSVEPAGGWYGYGFPVSTFRWGWFGAAHYYPTVFWHDGYYGDCCRYGYRRGY
jgi:hypothetical protein